MIIDRSVLDTERFLIQSYQLNKVHIVHCNSSPLSKQIQDPRIRFTKPEWATAVRAGRNSSSFVPKRHHTFYIYVFDVKVPFSIMAKWSWGRVLADEVQLGPTWNNFQ